MDFNHQKTHTILFSFCLLSSTIALTNVSLIAMDTNTSLPKLLVIDDKFPVYTRDFINEEIRALIQSEQFSVSVFSEDIITDPQQLAKLPDWMQRNPIEHLMTMPTHLHEYAIIFACWGHLGEKIAKLKHTGAYDGILVTRFRGAPEERIGPTPLQPSDFVKTSSDRSPTAMSDTVKASDFAPTFVKARSTDMMADTVKLRRAGRPDDDYYPYLKRYGDLYLPNCDFFRKELCEKFNFDAKKFIVHHESVDVNTINTMIAGLKPSNAINNVISILSVCRLEPKKGLNRALQAIAHLRKKNSMQRMMYTIVGEGSQRSELEEQIKKLELGDMVTMVGGKNKKEVIEMLVQSNILLAPSYTSQDGDVEGIMNVLKEAGLAGTTVVATDHAGAPELITHGITGVLAKQNDVADLADKLEYTINHFYCWPEWRSNLKKEIEKRFNGTRNHPQLIEILINTLSITNPTKK